VAKAEFESETPREKRARIQAEHRKALEEGRVVRVDDFPDIGMQSFRHYSSKEEAEKAEKEFRDKGFNAQRLIVTS